MFDAEQHVLFKGRLTIIDYDTDQYNTKWNMFQTGMENNYRLHAIYLSLVIDLQNEVIS
jgi:hypothetical protein